MMKKQTTLRKQFLFRILTITLIIAIISSGIQLYLMDKQMKYEIESQSTIISESINQGILETDLAAKNIEHQIDLKLVGYSKNIVDLLDKSRAEEITNEELIKIRDELGVAGLTILTRKDDDIVAVKATDPDEIGFSTKQYGDLIHTASEALLVGEEPYVPGAFTDKGILVLPILQSDVHDDEPRFFKYGYYHQEGSDYYINPYIEADEVSKFTKEVGTNSWIEKIEENNPFVREISVLDPIVFANPELEEQLYPPMKKVIYGNYKFQTDEDIQIMKDMAETPKKHSIVQTVNGERIFKVFLPMENNQVIYIAFDYNELTGPIFGHSIILVVAGLASLLALFVLTIKFFNKIYESIQKIINQITSLEEGDLTVKSKVNDGSELGKLSESTNRMVDKLNRLVTDTQEQASNTQRLSILLEAEASQSVEKMYEISTETTIKSREQLYEITEFLNEIEEIFQPYKDNKSVEVLLNKFEFMREVANERTAVTTDFTITLSDLLQSLHGQSSELSDISNKLLEHIGKFKL